MPFFQKNTQIFGKSVFSDIDQVADILDFWHTIEVSNYQYLFQHKKKCYSNSLCQSYCTLTMGVAMNKMTWIMTQETSTMNIHTVILSTGVIFDRTN
jgi:hypothetical protein